MHLHRATRTDLLAEGLATLLAQPPAEPFAQELVIVPAKGVERWLTQRLSHRLGAERGDDGVCAGVRFLTPNSLVTMLIGTDRHDPWLPEALVWPLLATIDDCLGQPWAATLSAHLGHGDVSAEGRLRAGRRYAVARRIAGLFQQYAVQRPALLRAWSSGPPWTDGTGQPLDPDLAWQAHLWRALVARMDGPTPPDRLAATVAGLRSGALEPDLPQRLSLFGHTRIAGTDVDLLSALAVRREVHLWLPHPAPALWAALEPEVASGPLPRAEDTAVLAVQHPLLASLGRDIRELQRALAPAGAVSQVMPEPGSESATSTWLSWLQADLRAAREAGPQELQERRLDPADRSIQVHACHGPARQVEVLRDVLLGLLADDPSLEPRDVLVMCPDIDRYAPLIQAAFGLAEVHLDGPAHPGHQLRVALADRSKLFTNPLLAVAAALVELAGGRITASEVLDLAATDAVRNRFGFDDDALERFADWAEQGAVRWGLDGTHRGEFLLNGLMVNTWRTGIDRLLLGVTRSEEADRSYRGLLPLDDVDSGSIDVVGRVAEFVDRLAIFRTACAQAQDAGSWMAALRDGVAALTAVPLTESWQHAELNRELDAVAGSEQAGIALSHSDIRSLLGSRLESRATRANFRTGSLTVCTMTPMRSVPHRVIALLGLDDGVFPRTGSPDGDDVLARSPQTGERDPRSEDRQLLLDAILAATDTLVITYSGADPHTGAHLPPAVPLGELIDAAQAAVGPAADAQPTRSPVRRHRLLPFDPDNLRPDPATGQPFSFDPRAGACAQALVRGRATPGSGTGSRAAGLELDAALPARPGADLTLEDLLAFFANPTRGFLRDRLGVAIPRTHEQVPDAIPIELDGLAQWQIGQRLVQQLVAGRTIEEIEAAEQQRGLLPPAGLGQRLLAEIGPRAGAIAAATARLLTEPVARSLDIEVDLGDGRRLTGTVPGIHGDAIVRTTYSSLSGRDRLEAWICLLAVTAASPATTGTWTAHAVGRWGANAATASAGPITAEVARTFLTDLIDLRELGLRLPLAFSPKTSYVYAAALHKRRGRREELALAAAREQWEKYHDQTDAAISMLYGPSPPLGIWLDPPSPDEAWEFAAQAESLPSRFGHTAMRVWRPALIAGIGQ